MQSGFCSTVVSLTDKLRYGHMSFMCPSVNNMQRLLEFMGVKHSNRLSRSRVPPYQSWKHREVRIYVLMLGAVGKWSMKISQLHVCDIYSGI